MAPEPAARTPSDEPFAKSCADVHCWYATRDCGAAVSAPAPGTAAIAVVARAIERRTEILRAEARAPDHTMATPRTATICSGTVRRRAPRVNALRHSTLY